MKGVAVCALVLLALTFALAKPAPDGYTTKFDNVDLDEILKNKRLLNNYVKCLMDEGPCTADGQELKKDLPDALENDCAKCSEKQKEGSRKVLDYLIQNENEKYENVEKKYDPTGGYKKKYCARAKEEKIETGKRCE